MAIESKSLLDRYYQEQDPMKRKKILEKYTATGEEPELNAIRKEIWEKRYSDGSSAVKNGRADGYLRIWMETKFADGNTSHFFGGVKRAQKSFRKLIAAAGLDNIEAKSKEYQELLYRECLHAATLYLDSCLSDKNYSTGLLGLMKLPDDAIATKISKDVYVTAIRVPRQLDLEKELAYFSRAALEVYFEKFPVDEFTEETGIRKEMYEAQI